ALLVAAGAMFTPAAARAQSNMSYEVPPPPGVTTVPWPVGSVRPEQGGWYVAGGFIWWRMGDPLPSPPPAVRGFLDQGNNLAQALGLPTVNDGNGTFIGSKAPALDVNQVRGPGTFEPGFIITAGYRFSSGIAVEGSYTYLGETKQSASATLAPFGNFGQFQEN